MNNVPAVGGGQELGIGTLDRVAVRQHRDDDVSSGHGFGSAVEHRDTVADRGFDCRGHRVETPHGVAGGDQIRRHRTAHMTEPQKRHGRHLLWPS